MKKTSSSNRTRTKKYFRRELIGNDMEYLPDLQYIKEEVTVNINESSYYDAYSDDEFTINTENDSISKQLNQYKNQVFIDYDLPDMADHLGTFRDLIDFTCTKCRRTSKNPDYYEKKTDLNCPECQSAMKFQCPRCKLLFRQFENACRHVKNICEIDDGLEFNEMEQFPGSKHKRPAHSFKRHVGSAAANPDSSPEAGGQRSENQPSAPHPRNCWQCEFTTPSTLELRRHVRLHHRFNPNPAVHACLRCKRAYKSRETMLKHARYCGQAPHIRCQFCTYVTKRREHLRVHMRHRHPDPDSCHGNTYDCPKCKKKYKYLTSMKSHMLQCG